jgi:outer membrane protein assembly factor BamD
MRFIIHGIVVLALAGCSSDFSMPAFLGGDGGLSDGKNISPPETLYAEADELMSSGNYWRAAEKFEEVDRQYPYSPVARRAIVMAAYAKYKDKKYPESIQIAKRYVTLHPGTKETALAQYLIASSHYEQMQDPARDQDGTRKALYEYQVLLRRYPDSRYATQAKNRIRIARDVLAGAEMNVGRYYQKRSNHLAAINRFKVVVSDYQTTAHVEEALMRLTESYMAIGVVTEAQTAAAILGHNFPESKWYGDSYVLLQSGGLAPREDTGSWLSKTWKTATKSLNPF